MNDTLHRMRFGAQPLDGGGTRFALWAPGCAKVGLEIVDTAGALLGMRAMQPRGAGWFDLEAGDLDAGTRYRYRVRDELAVPDPASRFNPQDVHGPSEVIDPRAFPWQQADWRGRPWRSAVICELHVGTFSPEGTYAGAAQRLPRLRDLGITAVELMPLADFPGRRNWGYDGVLPFAPDAGYGSPDDLRRFIDTAHGLGMMVLLDVVYNHFGPDGNYLGAYAPGFFDAQRHTPWGAALNFDGPGSEAVRRFFVDNALYWITEFRFDGLRLDAVHAIRDGSQQHLVQQIADALRDGPGRERAVHLVLENDDNIARWLDRDAVDGRPLIATAQWNDDLHHAAHVIATGEREGYYADYVAAPAGGAGQAAAIDAAGRPAAGDTVGGRADTPLERLGRAFAEGFIYQGEPSRHRGGEPRGEPSRGLPALAFVAFLQNHDQIGNRAFGERLDALAGASRVDALMSCLLLAPQVPMLFMGEEFAARTPFLYFCDGQGALADAVREGRRREFAGFAAFADPAQRARIPDPNADTSFEASRLDWRERDSPRGRARLALVGTLLGLRRAQLEPWLERQRGPGRWRVDGDVLEVRWRFGDPTSGDAAGDPAAGLDWTLRARFGATSGVDDAASSTLAAEPATVEQPVPADEEVVHAFRSSRRSAVDGGAVLVLQRDAVEISRRPAAAR